MSSNKVGPEAASRGHVGVIEVLLDAGANMSLAGVTTGPL